MPFPASEDACNASLMQAYELVIVYFSNIIGVVLSAPAKKLNLRHLRFLRTNKASFNYPEVELTRSLAAERMTSSVTTPVSLRSPNIKLGTA